MGEFLVNFKPLILTVHFFFAIVLIAVIMLQSSKGTDIGSMFGASGSQSVFGARGPANFLTRVTTITAILFLVSTLSLATISNYSAHGGASDSVIDSDPEMSAVPTENSKTSEDVDSEEAAPKDKAPAEKEKTDKDSKSD